MEKSQIETGFFSQLAWVEKNFVEIRANELVVLDLRYATTNNFMNENLYQGFARCFVHPETFEKFSKAQSVLASQHPSLQFHIWDALRPRSVQAKMFEHVQGTPYHNYVAPPLPGSMHNFGFALDLTLQKKSGELLEMGTEFDDFDDLAQPKLEKTFLESGKLSREAYENRQILRSVMESCGFQVLPHEWWHFNARLGPEVHGKYRALE